MKKSDLILQLAQSLGGRKEAELALDALLKSMQKTLRSGEKIILSGIGSFYPRVRKAQRRHNPKTMEPVLVPAKRIIKFIPSPELFKREE